MTKLILALMVVTRESKNIEAATSNGRNSLKQMNRGIFYIIGRKEVNIQIKKKLLTSSENHKIDSAQKNMGR